MRGLIQGLDIEPDDDMSIEHYQAATYKVRTSVGYLVRRANALILDNLEPAFSREGFTFIQWAILTRLRDGIALNPKDICSDFRHDSGALTRVIDQLEKRGLLERARALDDRRKVDLHLTAAGREAVESLAPMVVDGLNRSLGDFSRAEMQELTRLLIKFNEGLQQELERGSGQKPAGTNAAEAAKE